MFFFFGVLLTETVSLPFFFPFHPPQLVRRIFPLPCAQPKSNMFLNIPFSFCSPTCYDALWPPCGSQNMVFPPLFPTKPKIFHDFSPFRPGSFPCTGPKCVAHFFFKGSSSHFSPKHPGFLITELSLWSASRPTGFPTNRSSVHSLFFSPFFPLISYLPRNVQLFFPKCRHDLSLYSSGGPPVF